MLQLTFQIQKLFLFSVEPQLSFPQLLRKLLVISCPLSQLAGEGVLLLEKRG